jgi:ferredoxin--NADP+ reductase/benzoate/toluate 1,2-dioxygenase reductase subunit
MKIKTIKAIVEVHHVRDITSHTYVIRMDRGGMEFLAGQYLRLGMAGDTEKREYSIYSGEQESYLEVLIREVEDGLLSKNLRQCKPGRKLEIEGPFGFFKITEKERSGKKLYFIASGTGIAPFHSFVKSYEPFDYILIHGIRYQEEAYDHEVYRPDRYISCTSKDGTGTFAGRLTDYLSSGPVDQDGLFLLCGNSNMIHDAMDLLTEKGIPLDQIRAEVYF